LVADIFAMRPDGIHGGEIAGEHGIERRIA
jgi:hypothetical protein